MNKTSDLWHLVMSNLRMPKMQKIQRLATFFVGDQRREHEFFPVSSLLVQAMFPWGVCMTGSKWNIAFACCIEIHCLEGFHAITSTILHLPVSDRFFQLNSTWARRVCTVVRVCFYRQRNIQNQSDISWRQGPEDITTSKTHFFVFIISREAGCLCRLDGKIMKMCVPRAIENSMVCETCNDWWQPPSWNMYVSFSQVLIPLKQCIAVVMLTSKAINMRERYPGLRTKRCCEEPTESSCLACCPSAQASAQG